MKFVCLFSAGGDGGAQLQPDPGTPHGEGARAGDLQGLLLRLSPARGHVDALHLPHRGQRPVPGAKFNWEKISLSFGMQNQPPKFLFAIFYT